MNLADNGEIGLVPEQGSNKIKHGFRPSFVMDTRNGSIGHKWDGKRSSQLVQHVETN